MNFSEKSCKKWLISWKTIKNDRFNKNWHVFEQPITFRHLDEIFSEKLQKVADFVKSHEKSSIWPKLATFRANHQVSRFRWTFRKKVAKSGSFREKPWKIIDLAKTVNVSNKLTRFEVWKNFSEKSCKKWLISWKTSTKHRFGKNWQLFEQTIMFRGFDELFGKKLQRVAHFVRNHEKSSIWLKLWTFRTN